MHLPSDNFLGCPAIVVRSYLHTTHSFFRKAIILFIFQAPVAQRIPWEQRLHFRGMSWRTKRQLILQKRSLCLNGTRRMDSAIHRINHCPVGLQSLLYDPHDGSLGDYFFQCLLRAYYSCKPIKTSTCCLSQKTDYFVRRPLLCKIVKVRTDWVINYYLVRVITYWNRSPHETKKKKKKQTNISEQTFL